MVLQKTWLTPLLLMLFGINAFGQKDNNGPIVLQNPSFEDIPGAAKTPVGWFDCPSTTGQSPPDVQPGQFQVTKAASHGSTYLGLVARENATWEGVGQRLSRPLKRGQCYEFSMDLCRSVTYKSQVVVGTAFEEREFTTPIRLIIWGGNGFCNKREVLYETGPIKKNDWTRQTFKLSPKKGNWSHIMFEAYYPKKKTNYNGHILLDNASSIVLVDCPPKEEPAPPPAPPKIDSVQVAPPPPPVVTYVKLFRLKTVYFETDQTEINESSETTLDSLFEFLSDRPNISVALDGHTSNNFYPYDKNAQALSLKRAESVASWLIDKGIEPERIQTKGFGYTMPISPNLNAQGRNKNQRVEVFLLKKETK